MRLQGVISASCVLAGVVWHVLGLSPAHHFTTRHPRPAPRVARAGSSSHQQRRYTGRRFSSTGEGEDGEFSSITCDLAILGAGPVGVSAALKAAELGKRVVLVDDPECSGALLKDGEDLSLGGPTGLFSKALRDTSKRISVSTLRGGWHDSSVRTLRLIHMPRSPHTHMHHQAQLHEPHPLHAPVFLPPHTRAVLYLSFFSFLFFCV